MNWLATLVESVLWVLKAFGLSATLFLLVAWVLVKKTRWASQCWRLARPHLQPRQHPKRLLLLGIILFLSLLGVRISVLFSFWYKDMYAALQKMDEPIFWIQMVVFSVLATIHIIRALLSYFLNQVFSIQLREAMNADLLDRWFARQSYYRAYYLPDAADNPDQRIQQDVASFVRISLSLSLGLITSLVSTVAFTVILWGLSDDMQVFGLTIPRGMVFLLFIYVLLTTVWAFRIGRPLIHLNFLDERLGANYRYGLVRVREYAESIAIYGGEVVEKSHLLQQFREVIRNLWAIVYRNLKFQGFNFIVTQVSVVFPFIIQAPRYFAKTIDLGGMVQTAQAFGNLAGNLSFFRNAYDDFAAYRAVLNRLTEFYDNIEQTQQLPVPHIQTQGDNVVLDNLSVQTPSGDMLIQDLSLTLTPGQALLIQGPSGAGKTTLLRTIAGLWPYSQGQVYRPLENVLFLSQKPYLPLGSLRHVLYYPSLPPESPEDERLRQVLAQVQLAHLSDQLDTQAPWAQRLSLGEQQRIAFARLLLHRPNVAFLDEASSAMDEGLEFAMYECLRATLPRLQLISVGHRNTLHQHHTQVLTLLGQGKWQHTSN